MVEPPSRFRRQPVAKTFGIVDALAINGGDEIAAPQTRLGGRSACGKIGDKGAHGPVKAKRIRRFPCDTVCRLAPSHGRRT